MARRPGSRREAPSLKVPPSTSLSSWPSGERATRGVFSSRTSSRLLRATLTVCGKPGRGVTVCLTDLVPLAADLDLVRHRQELERLVGPAGGPAVDEELRVRRPRRDLHLAQPGREADRLLVPDAGAQARGDGGLVVALLRQPDHVLPARLDRELERRLAAVDPVHLDPRARGLAPDDEHRRRRRRRLSRGRGRKGDESDGETLLLPAPLDRHAGPELLVAVGADPDLALPRLRLERGERRLCPRSGRRARPRLRRRRRCPR